MVGAPQVQAEAELNSYMEAIPAQLASMQSQTESVMAALDTMAKLKAETESAETETERRLQEVRQ